MIWIVYANKDNLVYHSANADSNKTIHAIAKNMVSNQLKILFDTNKRMH
jgi:hypothetical protein